MLIDTHCHLNSLPPQSRGQVIEACSSGCVLINSSIDLESSKESLRLCGEHYFIYSALGFHPFSASQYDPQILIQYQELATNNSKVVAVGEIGLDHKADVPLERQEEIFREFIQLAVKLGLAIIVHNRLEGYKALDTLDDYLSSYENVVFHCFSYSPEFLDKIIAKGGCVSFSLNILRGNDKIIASLKKCPLENLLLETDSPYMRIEGKPSTPLDIGKVYEAAANIKEMDIKKLEEIVFANAKKIFKI